MAQKIDFWNLLIQTQKYISQHYAAALIDSDKTTQLRSYIEKYLRDNDFIVDGYNLDALVNRIYSEMAEYSVLTPYMESSEYEELNINGWDDIALTRLDGSIVKASEHFHSPEHAVDILKRLLHHSGMIIDNATPTAQGHLPGNTRVTALKHPIVDEERGNAASVRFLHPQRINLEHLADTGFATKEMVFFLCTCIRYGVPFSISAMNP